MLITRKYWAEYILIAVHKKQKQTKCVVLKYINTLCEERGSDSVESCKYEDKKSKVWEGNFRDQWLST